MVPANEGISSASQTPLNNLEARVDSNLYELFLFFGHDTSMTFQQRVFAVVKAIPRGTTMSYGEVADAAGSPGAARAVGSLMKQNHDLNVPCHRVIKSDGTPGEYNGGASKKIALLQDEGAL